jgi:hypothetical protein
MAIRYVGRDSYALYLCRRHTDTGDQIRCQSVAGSGVDAFVEERLLEAIRPAGIEAAIAAIEELERRAEDLRRQWQHRIEQAEYEAGLARRRYEAVDPDNRLVAGNLERDWEEKLREVETLKKQFAERTGQAPLRIDDAERSRLHELATDLPRLWRARTTKWSDRKRILRLLVREVWLTQHDEPRLTRVQIHWQTGAVTEGQVDRPLPIGLRFRTPRSVVARIRQLAHSKPPGEIAAELSREGLTTAQGKPFTGARVRALLREWKRKEEDATQPEHAKAKLATPPQEVAR